MYRRPKFLEILHEIREEMSREADYDVDLFAEMIRSGKKQQIQKKVAEYPERMAEAIEVKNGDNFQSDRIGDRK
jgi:hypothetical protein